MPYLGPGIDNGYRSRFIYTATAGQTSFSGGDSQGITLTYTDSEYLDVYQNGVLLVPGDDYAATTGTTVVLVQGASLNDKVEMIQYQAFGVADTVSRADGGAFGGNISTSGTLAVTGTSALTGNVTAAGTLAVTGVPTFSARSVHSGGITVANGGQIGSVGDADAIAVSSGGVVTFSQPPVGTGMDLLLDQIPANSSSGNYDISSTYINGTYDDYLINFNFAVENDAVDLRMRIFVGGTIQTGDIYGYEVAALVSSTYNSSNAEAYFKLNHTGIGNASGEYISGTLNLSNINTPTHPNGVQFPFTYSGICTLLNVNGAHNSNAVSGNLLAANRASVINGIRFYASSGEIYGIVKVYGLRT